MAAVIGEEADQRVHRRVVGIPLGGEQSGHIVCLDRSTTGDGILVALELLTGNAPFAARDDKVAKMYAHLQDPPPKPTESRSDLPPAIDAVMERAMAKDPAKRFETCREMIRATRTCVIRPSEREPLRDAARTGARGR